MTQQVATPPHIVLLRTMLASIGAVDFVGACGPDIWAIIVQANPVVTDRLTAGRPPLTVRYRRNRPPPGQDQPSVTLVWNGNGDANGGDYLSADERGKQMEFEIVIDMALPTEDSELDETGWLILSTVSAAAFAAVRACTDPETATSVVLDWAEDGDLNPDEDASGPDNGRLVQAGTVLYRVSTNDPNVLLAPGV